MAALLTGALGVAALAGGGAAVALPAATPSAGSAGTSGGTDYTKLVDPFVSTAGDDGNDLPGAQAPHGLAKVNPLTTPNRNHTGYDYNEDHIAGFTATNLDGVGGSGGGGDLLVVPTSVQYDSRPAAGTCPRVQPRRRERDARLLPGGPRRDLRNRVVGEAGLRHHQGRDDRDDAHGARAVQLPRRVEPELVLDLANNFTSRTRSTMKATTLPDGTTSIAGLIAGSFNGASYKLYYNATTNVPVTSLKSWGNDGKLSEATTQDGSDTGAVLGFDKSAGDDIELRITLSPISAEQAATDQRKRGGPPHLRAGARAVEGGLEQRARRGRLHSSAKSDPGSTLTKEFYTHLYRMYALPVNATSTSGTYRGADGAVHKANGFTYYDGWSTWDDFRKYSVEAYIDPATYRDMMQSLIELFADVHTSGKSLGSLTHSVPTVRWSGRRAGRRRAVEGLQELRPARRGLPGAAVVHRLLHGRAAAAGICRG